MSPSDFDDVLRDHETARFQSKVHAVLHARLAEVSARGRKRVHKNLLTFEGKVDRSAVLGVMANWLFNYNTVEAIMSFAAVVRRRPPPACRAPSPHPRPCLARALSVVSRRRPPQIVSLMGIMYMAQTTNPYYSDPAAGDAITAIVLIAIIAAIVYFLVVLVTEMVVLYTESQREAAAKRAAAKRSGKTAGAAGGAGAGAGGKGGSGRKLTTGFGGGEVDDGALTPNIGAVSSETNPMFLRSADAGMGASATAAFDSIMAQREAPSQSLWVVFQTSYADLRSSATQLAEQLAAVRTENAKLAARLATGEGGPGEGSEPAALPASITRRNKTAFAPTASAADGDDAETSAGAASPLGARGRAGSNPGMRRTPSGLGGGGAAAAAAAAVSPGGRTMNPLRATRAGGSGRSASGRSRGAGGDDE